MNNLDELKDEIVIKGFPELLDEDIKIEYQELEEGMFSQGEFKGGGYYIDVDETLKEAPKEVLEGGIAHEISHIVIAKKTGRLEKLMDDILYRIYGKYESLVERNTDIQTIMRGYGKQLLEMMRYSEGKMGYNHFKEDGLSIAEIKSILNHKNEQ
jgi:hypothetical protein